MRVAGEGRTASQGGPHWGVHLDGVGVVGEEISTIITAATHPHAVSATHPMLCQQHTPCCVSNTPHAVSATHPMLCTCMGRYAQSQTHGILSLPIARARVSCCEYSQFTHLCNMKS